MDDDFYKDDDDENFALNNIKDRNPISEIDHEIIRNESKFFEFMDSLFNDLNSAMIASDLDAVRKIVEEIIPYFNDIYLNIYEHVINQTEILNESLSYIVSNEDDFVPPLLRLLRAFCSAPDNKTSQNLLKYDGFIDRLKYFLMESENPIIFACALNLTSQIYRECMVTGYPFDIEIDENIIARPIEQFTGISEEILEIYSVFLKFTKEATIRNLLVIYSTDLINEKINLVPILDVFRECIKKDSECFDLMNQNETKFLQTKLIDIIAPYRGYKNSMMVDNAISALRLLSYIIKKIDKENDSERHQQCNSILSNMNWMFVLKDIQTKPSPYIESVFKLLAYAYPTRSWLRQTIKENGIFDLFPDLLQESQFKARYAVLKFLNVLIKYNLNSSNLDDFDILICQEFVELLIDLSQNSQWDFVLEVFKTIKNLCDLSMTMEQPQVVTDFKCEQLSDVFDEIEDNDQEIPKQIREQLLNYITILKDQIDMICDNV